MFLLQKYVPFILILMVFTSSPAQALEIPKGVKVLSAPEVQQMVTNGGYLLVHTLSRIEYQMQHIPGSINIPVDEVKHSPSMPADKKAGIIFYCNGEACPYSKRAAKIAVQQGYTNVYWFRGGILEWRRFQYDMVVNKELNAIKIKKLSPLKLRDLAQGDVIILDVRPQWWRQSKAKDGVIEGTRMMIPLLNLDQHLDLLSSERPIIVVDRLMRQSPHAAKFLKKQGFTVLGVVKGGARRWVKEGLPILQKEDEPTMVIGD